MDPATARLTALLGSLTNYERRRPDQQRWSLDNMLALLARPGCELPAARRVQVGGSKGKGTAVLYLERLAEAAGLRTAAYLSPHLRSLLERVRLRGREVDEAALAGALGGVLAFARETGLEPTFFEVMTAAALDCFAREDLDLAILEVGLGGRLDATTAVPVAASILTTIELEHTALLGDTVEAIAAEKAFVIRPGCPAFTAAAGPALAVFEARAAAVGARLSVLGRDFGLEDVREHGGGYRGRLRGPGGEAQEFTLPGASAFELPALALAASCLETLWPGCVLPLDPVPRPALPGRCQVLACADGVPLVVDGAHTESSLQALAGELARRFPGRRLAVLFASSAGKRWREGLRALLPAAEAFYVTALTDTRGEPPEEIVAWLSGEGAAAEPVADAEAGLCALAGHRGVRVVTGSFYLAGEALGHPEVLGFETLNPAPAASRYGS